MADSEMADPGVTDRMWSRQHMLDADYLSRWYPKRATERREYLARIDKASPFWLGTPAQTA